MFLSRKERRYKKRYAVSWEALLKVSFPGLEDRMVVRVVDFSIQGALLHSERISVDSRHLVVTGQRPELTLRILSPEGALEAKIDIRWYTWSHEKGIFEIGIEFLDILKENQVIVDEIIENLST